MNQQHCIAPAPRRTRIVATIGPASRDPKVLQQLFEAGVDVCRLNCSHSDPDRLRADVANIRTVASAMARPVAILLDLQGPKVRTGPASVPLELAPEDKLSLIMDPEFSARPGAVGCTLPSLAQDLTPGDRVLFADGALEARVESVHRDEQPARVQLRLLDGGELGGHKGINLPDSALSTPSLTAKDKRDLAVGVAAGVDYVALSFVRCAEDIDALRAELALLGRADLPVCAKIEKPQALDDIDRILRRVEAIMVARGDLGVEIALERVPVVQKQLIQAANRAGVLVVTATQMLESMMQARRPTRAEATDVANAILDGTDAVMLSGETAVGRWPVRAVQIMDRLARAAEASPYMIVPDLCELPAIAGVGATVARAACFAVRELPRPLVVFTWSGFSAVVASKSRPPCGLIALSPVASTVEKLALAWGVRSLAVPLVEGTSAMIAAAERILLEHRLVLPGSEVVVLAGKTHTRGSTNMMTVERFGSE